MDVAADGLQIKFTPANLADVANIPQPSVRIGGGLHAPIHIFSGLFTCRVYNTSPPLATASAVAQAHWRLRRQNKSQALSLSLRQPACNKARAEQPIWWCKGLLSAQFSPAAAAAQSLRALLASQTKSPSLRFFFPTSLIDCQSPLSLGDRTSNAVL